jgi:DNA-binding MarR family transcriptional regulator
MTVTPAPSEPVDAAEHPLGDDTNWLLHRVSAGLGGVVDAAARKHGLGIRAHVVLSTIHDSGPLTQLGLGQLLALDKTAVTAVLDQLESSGWIVRTVDPNDRRARRPEITRAGRALVTKSRVDVQEAEQAVLAELSDEEVQTLRALLRRLAFGRVAETAPVSGSCL